MQQFFDIGQRVGYRLRPKDGHNLFAEEYECNGRQQHVGHEHQINNACIESFTNSFINVFSSAFSSGFAHCTLR